ncbi:tenascin isoform x1 [Cystoisospora suis]|uniref:Tenascin isoform x1 n=1 Tax=Cystoisospora suis TaxID=483139 RepID=A0A2C6KI14_9APIC|nr:tenascin isoform x1 [Cystoisospora suis]
MRTFVAVSHLLLLVRPASMARVDPTVISVLSHRASAAESQLARPCVNGCSGNGWLTSATSVCKSEATEPRRRLHNPRLCLLPGMERLQGICIQGVCKCLENFTGDDCSLTTSAMTDCSGHGECVRGECKCRAPWTGADCNVRVCPNMCSGHGTHPSHLKLLLPTTDCQSGDCDQVTGRCVCHPYYGGDSCAEPRCPRFCSGVCENERCRCFEGTHTRRFGQAPRQYMREAEQGFRGADCSFKIPGSGDVNAQIRKLKPPCQVKQTTCTSPKLAARCPGKGDCSQRGTCSGGKQNSVTSPQCARQVRSDRKLHMQRGYGPGQRKKKGRCSKSNFQVSLVPNAMFLTQHCLPPPVNTGASYTCEVTFGCHNSYLAYIGSLSGKRLRQSFISFESTRTGARGVPKQARTPKCKRSRFNCSPPLQRTSHLH